ncbi:hypothetical protein Leryth_021127 [Lithospermum erythrorhizon]|nr:hypothetical protein Leryth_021127 [Lithospermum erythrorhizon]
MKETPNGHHKFKRIYVCLRPLVEGFKIGCRSIELVCKYCATTSKAGQSGDLETSMGTLEPQIPYGGS